MTQFRTIGSIPDDVEGKLEDLPDRSVIIDCEGDAWQKKWNLWYVADEPSEGVYHGEVARYQPFQVVWEGERR